jgi:hypothetical protein
MGVMQRVVLDQPGIEIGLQLVNFQTPNSPRPLPDIGSPIGGF